jgi:hypothetical protein
MNQISRPLEICLDGNDIKHSVALPRQQFHRSGDSKLFTDAAAG